MKTRSNAIRVSNRNPSYKISELFLEKLAGIIMRSLKKAKDAEIEIVLLDDKGIRKLNKQFKKEDSATDVLSFRIDRDEFGRKKFLGEVVISLDTARRNSGLFGTEFEYEIVRYVIHGILHLFGYDDLTEKERTRMWQKQEKLLGELCRLENLSKVLTRR
jgi:probable rRNA maturation factor